MSGELDPTAPLVASGNLRRRQVVSRVMASTSTAASLLAIGVLGVVLLTVVQRGGGALSLDFLIREPPQFGGASGGIAPAIVGTGVIVAMATLIAMPLGVLIAVYLTELASPRVSRPIRLVLDVMNGLPTIIIGLFVFGLLVSGHKQTGFAGSVALSIIMLPLVARASQEMLLLVPGDLREAADALGVARWRTVLTVILPAALGGIVTGTALAVARAAGETAPLLLASSIFAEHTSVDVFGQALPNIPVEIFILSEQADPSGFERAWGAAFVLLAAILITNVAARTMLARSRAKLSR